MRHVRKKHEMGCAIASAAMIGGITYEEVAALSREVDPAKTRWPEEFQRLLENVSQTKWHRHSVGPLPLSLIPCHEWPKGLFITDSYWHASFGQWIVMKAKLAYDPGSSYASLLRDYPRKDWLVTEVVELVEPGHLRRREQPNRDRFVMDKLRADILGSLSKRVGPIKS